MILKLALGTLFLFLILFGAIVILKRSKSKDEDFMFDLRSFEPQELERLKGKGLLTEDEAKRVQSVIADRAVDWHEKIKTTKDTTPVDINTLLAEADHYKRNFEKSKNEPAEKTDQPAEEDSKE